MVGIPVSSGIDPVLTAIRAATVAAVANSTSDLAAGAATADASSAATEPATAGETAPIGIGTSTAVALAERPASNANAAPGATERCAEERRLADERCELATRARTQADAAEDALRLAQRTYDGHEAAALAARSTADPRAVHAAKEAAQGGFRAAVAAASLAGHLEDLVNIEKRVENLMRGREYFHLFFRKNLVHLCFEVFPFAPAPKIIQVKETASEQILANPGCFHFRKKHASGLDRVDKGILEKVGIHWRDDVRIRTDAQAGQAMNAAHELAISAGIVRSPTPALLWEKILTAKLRTLILWRNRHGRYSETAESPVVVTATSCWVFVICQSCEEEFWRIGRAVGENGRQPDKAAGAYEQGGSQK
jgi:hypothetical protein